jgi:DNA-binding NarL/FixJ family response regulator
MAAARTRIVIADDHRLVLEALQNLLEPNYEVVGTASEGLSLLQTAPSLRPDVVIVDLIMPLLSGIEAALRLKTLMPAVKLIFLTMNDDPEIATKAMREGASAYRLKTSAPQEPFDAIRVALKGGTYMTPLMSKPIEEVFIQDPEGRGAKQLALRQREVVQLLAEGKSMKEAAAILKVTPRTIASHKYAVMERLGVKTTAKLIQFAIQNHILIA